MAITDVLGHLARLCEFAALPVLLMGRPAIAAGCCGAALALAIVAGQVDREPAD